MHGLSAAGAAAGGGVGAAAELGATAAAVGEALRAVRERVRAAVVRCGSDSHSGGRNSSSSNSSDDSSSNAKGRYPSSTCNSASAKCELLSSGATEATATPVGVRVRLVAVSKRQTAAAVAAAAAAGQRHFAENYVQELISKSGELKHLNLSWHMIGHLQSNKAKQLMAACPDLYMVETVDSIRLAHVLDAAVAAVMPQRAYKPLRVLVQITRCPDMQTCALPFIKVNTSGEDSKSGLRLCPKGIAAGAQRDDASPSRGQEEHGEQQQALHQQQHVQQLRELQALVQCIMKECSHLRFAGLMTIGPADVAGARQAFAALATLKWQLLGSLPTLQALFTLRLASSEGSLPRLRDEEATEADARTPLDDYSVDEKERVFELSMGMTSDFEEAIQAGSTEVRLGTAVFGQRC